MPSDSRYLRAVAHDMRREIADSKEFDELRAVAAGAVRTAILNRRLSEPELAERLVDAQVYRTATDEDSLRRFYSFVEAWCQHTFPRSYFSRPGNINLAADAAQCAELLADRIDESRNDRPKEPPQNELRRLHQAASEFERTSFPDSAIEELIRCFARLGCFAIPKDADNATRQFQISVEAGEYVESCKMLRRLTALLPTTGEKLRPNWNRESNELHYAGEVVRRFSTQTGEDVRNVLSVFEEEGWPECVNNPLPTAEALRYAIRTINSTLLRLEFAAKSENAWWSVKE